MSSLGSSTLDLSLAPYERTLNGCSATDCQYIQQGASDWLTGWKHDRWWNSQKRPIANPDLWKLLDLEQGKRDISWKWIRGHSGDPLNEAADRIASEEAGRVRMEKRA